MNPSDGTTDLSQAAASFSGAPGSRLGSCVVDSGDLNQDGNNDIAVGAPDYEDGTDHTGAAFLFLNHM